MDPIIFDTTLREGFQTPGGIGGSLEERVYAAAIIQRFAHWVELGIPANPVDYPIISAIRDTFKEKGYPAGIAVLARCNPADIEKSAEVMGTYEPNMIHLFVGTSEQHRKNRFKQQKSVNEYQQLIKDSVQMAASSPVFSRVMFSPEDAYRTFMQDPELLIEFINAAKEGYDAGNNTVGRQQPIIFNLPDTVGYSTIMEFGGMIQKVQEVLGDSIELSVHGHNDSKMALAQAIDVYQRFGVPWIQTTRGQLGERNGIASTEDVIKVLVERGVLRDSRITEAENLKDLDASTRAVLWALGRDVPEEHLDRVCISTAGIHTDLTTKDTSTYHIHGDRFGSVPIIELGPTSGRAQVIDLLEKHEIEYTEDRLVVFTDQLKKVANERKSPLSTTHVLYEAMREFCGCKPRLSVDRYTVTTTEEGSTRLIMRGQIDGRRFNVVNDSYGPVEASMDLLNKLINRERGTNEIIQLYSYKTRIIPVLGKEFLIWDGQLPKMPQSIGNDAHLAISLTFLNGSGTYHGWARHRNSTNAEVEAVIDGMTKMYTLQQEENQLKF